MGRSKGLKFLFFINFLVFLGCAIYVGQYFYEGYKSENKIDDLKEKMKLTDTDTKNRKTGNFTEADMLESYRQMRNTEYPDLVGHIIIEDAPVDYFVMQTSKQDPEKYLYRDVKGDYNKEGTPFMDYKSDLCRPSSNMIIYAHAMLNQHKFGSLQKYKDKDYYDSHKIIKFETMYEPMADYEVVAAAYSKVFDTDNKTDFKYYDYASITDQKTFDEFVSNVKQMSCYDTGITPNFETDRLITLSTCNKEKDQDGRFFVVAKKTVK